MQGISLNRPVTSNAGNLVVPQHQVPQLPVTQQDQFMLRFGAKREISAPSTIEGSRYVNDRLTISNDVLKDLVATLDASMTVVGEAYAGNEAFTTLYQVDFTEEGQRVVDKRTALDVTVDSAVEFAEKNRMVLTSTAKNLNGRMTPPIASAKATFVAVNPASVGPGKTMKTEGVQSLSLQPEETEKSEAANQWNADLSGFYKSVSGRLGTRDTSAVVEDLARAKSTDTRLINRSVYVTPDMLNKKSTGHGGIAAANATKDMLALADRIGMGNQISNLTASYQSPFFESDALQFDTTLDYADDENLYFSTRIYRFDTKGFDEAKPDERNRTVEGPVILVHGKVKALPYTVNEAQKLLKTEGVQLSPATEEAKQWKALLDQ